MENLAVECSIWENAFGVGMMLQNTKAFIKTESLLFPMGF